jgi:8-oxo-dGTP pyrophosphatase MutT (NUDIX family)
MGLTVFVRLAMLLTRKKCVPFSEDIMSFGFEHCTRCGYVMELVRHAQELPQVCGACKNKHFHPPAPTAIGLVTVYEDRGRMSRNGLLCVHRRRPGGAGPVRRALPGGYVHRCETLEQAVAREVCEETGLVTDATLWQYVGSTWSTLGNESLVFFAQRRPVYSWENVYGTFTPNNEVEDISPLWFDDEPEQNPLCFPTHKQWAWWFIEKGFHDQYGVPQHTAL